MAIQMIFCLETNKRANTDYIYIRETIDYLYQTNNQIKISPVYMCTKTKYKSKDVLREIEKKVKAFTIGQSKVFYCIDTDEYEISAEHENALQDIRKFCDEKGFEFIWFCHDVEEVFLGRKVHDSQKVQEAGAFRKRNGINEVSLKKLSEKAYRLCTSNIICVLDKYLDRK